MQLAAVAACCVPQTAGVQQQLFLNGSTVLRATDMASCHMFELLAHNTLSLKAICCAGPPSFGCNAQRGFTLPLGRTVQSGAKNVQSSAQACCTSCKATHECTVWSWCSDAEGQCSVELLNVVFRLCCCSCCYQHLAMQQGALTAFVLLQVVTPCTSNAGLETTQGKSSVSSGTL